MSVVPIYDISRNEIIKYTDQVKGTQGVFSMIQESFNFDFSTFQSIDDEDLQRIIRRVQDDHLRALLEQAILAGDNGSKYSDHCIPDEIGFKKAFFAFKKRNGKYDVVYCTATQIRRADWGKIGTAIGLATVAGAVAGGAAVVATGGAAAPFVLGGAAVGAGVGSVGAGTAAIIQKRDISNVVMGYIGKELSDRNLLKLV